MSMATCKSCSGFVDTDEDPEACLDDNTYQCESCRPMNFYVGAPMVCSASCGWSGSNPSITQGSEVKWGPVNTVKVRRYSWLCPRCFAGAHVISLAEQRLTCASAS